MNVLRRVALVICVQLILIMSLLALAEEKPGPSSYYFPTSVGARWVYLLNGKEEVVEVTAVKQQRDSIIVTVQQKDQFDRVTESVLEVSESGLVRLTGGGPSVHPPMQLLLLPSKPSESWTWETYMSAFFTPKSTMNAFCPEEIEVPAGKFSAIRVETIFPQKNGTEILAKYWYAPGVGLVKSEYGTRVRELKQFKNAN